MDEDLVVLTKDECRSICDLIDLLSGGNPESVFDWKDKNDPFDPTTSACVKIYRAAGMEDSIPDDL